MPVEIKELVIRTVVDETKNGSDNDEAPDSNGSCCCADSETLINECVHQVLNILARKNER
jgi:hypothetical protein